MPAGADLAQRDALAHPDVLARAALALFESEDPETLECAIGLVCPDLHPTCNVFDAIIDVWERYRHIRYLPWD